MSMPAIPTRYQGVNMRSRLEARWAAMFDLFGWDWEYEPLDLHGYIPDFVVHLPATTLLVEVKPIADVCSDLHDTADKINASGWAGDAWIAPVSPLLDGGKIGWARRHDYWIDGGLTVRWDNAQFLRCSGHDLDHVALVGHDGCCMTCGTRIDTTDRNVREFLLSCWREAGNMTQWRGAGSSTERDDK